ncbi:DNA glycosylase [Irpex rosettiformis]|uniref:DNA glycosylase n=1 Tax=Irpex rosettiformis TaxID=378272 RepID=A0ACB8UGU8_9APHY|nr:DNA glycosylase [Irpex rosettiformis]
MATTLNLVSGFRRLPLPISQLSLDAVLQCGQSFRWSVFPLKAGTADCPTHEYRLCLRDRVVCLRQTSDALHYRSVLALKASVSEQEAKEEETLAWINDYFQLNVDLLELYEHWGKRDSVFLKVKERFSGIRILRQDPFECLLSFICSSNNNITRITKMVKSLCTEYSPALVTIEPPLESISDDLKPQAYYAFPCPSTLALPEVTARLRALGFGYRADFIQKTAKMLVDAHGSTPKAESSVEPAEEWLKTLRNTDTATARAELLKLMGVGRKVADCVLLMSLDKREVVPVDTHVHQIAVKHYGLSGSKAKQTMTPALYEQVNSKLVGVWGGYAGWAHSVLFTSDLKAFSSYGLQVPTPSLSSNGTTESSTPIPSPSPSPRKRKMTQVVEVKKTLSDAVSVLGVKEITALSIDESLSMVDRVKRRRRGKAIP